MLPGALRALHLSAAEGELWAATSPVNEQALPPNSKPGQVTVVRYTRAGEAWTQLLGASTTPTGAERFPDQAVTSIAAEPGGGGAWLALAGQGEVNENSRSPLAFATVAHVAPDGTVSSTETLPSQAEQEHGVGPKGAASRIVCPAAHDCWLATTQGWLFHLTTGTESLQLDDDGFSSLITSRPHDEGLPQVPPDAPPEESAAPAEVPAVTFVEKSTPPEETRITVPLLTHLRSRLVHGSTLELSFHLAVKTRLRLVAKRRSAIVASTPTLVLAAGNRKVLLRLNPHRWPTKLQLQTHALAPLPTESARSPSVDTVSTALVTPSALSASPQDRCFDAVAEAHGRRTSAPDRSRRARRRARLGRGTRRAHERGHSAVGFGTGARPGSDDGADRRFGAAVGRHHDRLLSARGAR